MTEANAEKLLDAAAGRSKRQVEGLVAAHAPQPDVPSSVRKVPVRATAAGVPGGTTSVGSAPVALLPAASLSTRPDEVRPLAPSRYEMRFTASAETCAKLKRAQDLLRHAIPSGDTAAIVDRALTLLVADLERRKFGATTRPRPRPRRSRSTSDSRTPPADVRRAVSRRDGDRCAYVSKDGRRCDERGFLEFHHVIPYAMGGETTVENIQLRCRAHNGYEADLFYGKGPEWDGGEVVRESRTLYGATRSGPSSFVLGRAASPPS